MINAVGAPQSLLLLGGTSDIALAIARRYARPGLRIVLAARPTERRTAAATELKNLGCEITEQDEGLEVVWLFRPNLISQTEIEELDRLFQSVLATACRSPESRVADLTILQP